MSLVSRALLGAIAVIAAVGAVILLVAPGPPGEAATATARPSLTAGPSVASAAPTSTPTAMPTSSPTAAPAPSAKATVPGNWATYRSDRFAYLVKHPSGWVVTPATDDWPNHHLPAPLSPTVDRFGASRDSATYLSISSDPLGPDQVPAERIAQLDFVNAGEGASPPACLISDHGTITLDGVDARQEEMLCFEKDHLIEVAVVHGGRFYLLDIVSSAPLDAPDRATFASVVASFRFGD